MYELQQQFSRVAAYRPYLLEPYVAIDMIHYGPGYPEGQGLPIITLDVSSDTSYKQKGEKFIQRCMARYEEAQLIKNLNAIEQKRERLPLPPVVYCKNSMALILDPLLMLRSPG